MNTVSEGNPNEFMNFFINSVPQCNTMYNSVNSDYINIRKDIQQQFNFKEISVETFDNTFRKIKSNANGPDFINLKMLSLVFPNLSTHMTYIINYCLKNGVYPAVWRDADIIPIPKISNPHELNHFRPISLLPTISKVTEKIIYEQMITYIENTKILPSTQSGFRAGYSTTTALLQVTDDIYKAYDDGLNTCLIMLDFSKAFDTLHHNILLQKLHYFGFSDDVVSFFNSYLKDRRQRVRIGDEVSCWVNVDQGVLQESILGPILFSIYTADFPCKLNYCRSHQYADDTQLYYTFSKDAALVACTQINEDLNNIYQISNIHNLQLNETKTKILLFGKDRLELKNGNDFVIQLNNINLEFTDNCKNLGIYLDTDLQYSRHISSLVQNSVGKLKMLYLNKDILDPNIKKQLCESLILARLSYCDDPTV